MNKLIALLAYGSFLFSGCNPSYANQAEARFAKSFSGSEIFDCYSGNTKIRIGVETGVPKEFVQWAKSNPTAAQLSMSIGVESLKPQANKIEYFWGATSFTNDDKTATIKTQNASTMTFMRTGPTPSWPFKSRKDSQPFFEFRVDGRPSFKCKAVYQPEQ